MLFWIMTPGSLVLQMVTNDMGEPATAIFEVHISIYPEQGDLCFVFRRSWVEASAYILSIIRCFLLLFRPSLQNIVLGPQVRLWSPPPITSSLRNKQLLRHSTNSQHFVEPKVQCRVHKITLLVPILSQKALAHTPYLTYLRSILISSIYACISLVVSFPQIFLPILCIDSFLPYSLQLIIH
jgi:hypothetical protein